MDQVGSNLILRAPCLPGDSMITNQLSLKLIARPSLNQSLSVPYFHREQPQPPTSSSQGPEGQNRNSLDQHFWLARSPAYISNKVVILCHCWNTFNTAVKAEQFYGIVVPCESRCNKDNIKEGISSLSRTAGNRFCNLTFNELRFIDIELVLS